MKVLPPFVSLAILTVGFVGLEAYARRVEPKTFGSVPDLVPDPLLGFRNPAPPTLRGDTLILGDSLVWWSGSWARQLEDATAAGVPGYTTHQERLWYERDLHTYHWRRVVLSYCLNDAGDATRVLAGREWPMLTDPVGAPAIASSGWDGRLLRSSAFLRRLYLGTRPAPTRHPCAPVSTTASAWEDGAWVKQGEELRELQAAVPSLLVVVTPLKRQYLCGEPDAWKPQERLREVLPGVPMLDLQGVLSPEDFMPDGIHQNKQGAEMVRVAVEEWLRQVVE